MLVAVAWGAGMFFWAALGLTGLGVNWWFGRWALAANFVLALVLVYAAYFLAWQRQYGPIWRYRTRLGQGLCLSCGYDLRESTGRCPECGRRIEEWRYRAMGSVRWRGKK